MPSRLTVVLVSLLLASPAVVFWLWLVILPVRVAILCPEGCKCDTAGYSVKCKFLPVNPVPLIHFRNVLVLTLEYNEIKFFERDSFISMTELRFLAISGHGLRTIEVGTFNGLTKLTNLAIRDTDVSEILTGTFENLKSLKILYLERNKLQRVDIDVFSGLVKLKHIDLSANQLQYLHPDTFLGLPKLEVLSINGNNSLQIPTDRNFINSHSLLRLNMALCDISSVSVETFANVSALEWLDLSSNNLKALDINILRALPKLSTLHLHGNPLQCECQLQDVWRWFEDRKIQTEYLGRFPQCETPIEVKGMWWGVLQKGQCLEGNIKYYGDYKNTTYRYPDIGKQAYNYKYKAGFLKRYQVPVYAVPIIFGTTGNIILLIIIICNKDMRTVPNMYIVNLAVSDIFYLALIFSEAWASRISYMWLDGEYMCIFLAFCRRMSVGLSAYTVALYSIQRYRVTVKPFQILVSSPPTWRGIVVTLCAVWIVAALFAVPSGLSKYQCSILVSYALITYYQRVVIFELLVSCVLPLFVIVFTYIMTARHLVESSRALSEGTQNPQLKTRRNIAKIVVGLTVVFVISSVPYHVFWTYFICSHECTYNFISNAEFFLDRSNYKLQYMYLISTSFLLINPCLNPVSLFCTSSPFRQHLKRYLTCFCKTNSPPTDLELTRRN